jgi:hypothetical protein
LSSALKEPGEARSLLKGGGGDEGMGRGRGVEGMIHPSFHNSAEVSSPPLGDQTQTMGCSMSGLISDRGDGG